MYSSWYCATQRIAFPGTWLKEGVNTITVIELQSYTPEATAGDCLYITDTRFIDGPVNANA